VLRWGADATRAEGRPADAAFTEGSAAVPADDDDGAGDAPTGGEPGDGAGGAEDTAPTAGRFASKPGAEATETRAPPKLAVKTFWLPGGLQKNNSEPEV
jgi:hypothetical protein